MARAVYEHELQDPDFSWLVSNFQENNTNYILVESGSLPIVLIQRQNNEVVMADELEREPVQEPTNTRTSR